MTNKRRLDDLSKNPDKSQETTQNPQKRQTSRRITLTTEARITQPTDLSIRNVTALNRLMGKHGVFGTGHSIYGPSPAEVQENNPQTLQQSLEAWQRSADNPKTLATELWDLDTNAFPQEDNFHQSKKKDKQPENLTIVDQTQTDNLLAEQINYRQQLANCLTQPNEGSSYVNVGGNLRMNYNDLTEIDTQLHKIPTYQMHSAYSQTSERSIPETRSLSKKNDAERPRTYEEWKKTEEGKNLTFEPVQSPGGQIYGYDKKDFEGFKRKTKMELRPSEDQIQAKQLNNVVTGRQKMTGKGKNKWTSPHPETKKKLQDHLNKEKERKKAWREDLKKDEEKYIKHLDKQNEKTKERYKNLKKDEEKYKDHLDKQNERSKEWYKNLKKDEEKYKDHIKKQKEKHKEWREDMKDPDKRSAHFERRYNRQKERYERALYILSKKIDEVDTLTRYNELEKEKEQLTKAWDTFQQKHLADLTKLGKLTDTYNEVATTLIEHTATLQPSELHNPQQNPLLLQHMQQHLDTLDTQIHDYLREEDELTYFLNYFENTYGPSNPNADQFNQD